LDAHLLHSASAEPKNQKCSIMQQEQKKITKIKHPIEKNRNWIHPLERKKKRLKLESETKRRNEMGGTFPPR